MKKYNFIWILLITALCLRVLGLFEGLPAAYNSTEYFLSKTTLGMGARQSIDPLIYIYPTAYMYILAGLYGVLYISGTVIGIFSNTGDFAIRYLIDPSLFYLAGRVANILFSLLTVLMLYVRSQKLFGETTARFAAALSAFSYYYIQFSRFAVSDTLLILFSTLAILTLLETYRSASRKNYLLSGFFIGLAIGMKYNAGFLVLGLFTLIILHWREHRRENLWKYGSASIFAIIVGFLVLNPLWLLRFSDFYDGYILMSTQMQSAVSLEFGLNYIWEIREIFSHELVIGIGFFVSTLFFLIKRKSLHLILLIPLLVTFLYVGSWQKKGVDYLFAIFPAWIVLFSMWLDQVWGKLEKQKLLRNTLIVLVFLPSLLMSIHQNILALRMDTREKATEWLKNNLAGNTKICYDHYTFDLGLFDVHRYTEYGASSGQLPEEIKRRLLPYQKHPRNISNVPVVILYQSPINDGDNLYENQMSGYRRKSVEELQAEDVTYLVTNSWYYGPYLECDRERFSPVMKEKITEVRRFYSDVKNKGKEIIAFQPDFWTPGPIVKVYDISQN